MIIKKYFSIILLLVITVTTSFETIISSEYIFSTQQRLGISLLIISALLLFINHKIYKYFYTITLVAGIAGIISFSTYSLAFGTSLIRIELIPFLALIVFFYFEKINPFKIFSSSEEEKIEASERLIKSFELRFKNLSDEQISNKLEENLTSEAIIALKNIKGQRMFQK